MIIPLIIVTIGLVLSGYFLMQRLDNYIDRGGIRELDAHVINKDVMLYGESENIAEICCALDAINASYDYTPEPEVNEDVNYQWVCAISQDDTSNLLFCLSAKRRNSEIRTMAKCNNKIYEDIFVKVGIEVVLHNNDYLGQILAHLKGKHK